jgi:hypothetical protein
MESSKLIRKELLCYNLSPEFIGNTDGPNVRKSLTVERCHWPKPNANGQETIMSWDNIIFWINDGKYTKKVAELKLGEFHKIIKWCREKAKVSHEYKGREISGEYIPESGKYEIKISTSDGLSGIRLTTRELSKLTTASLAIDYIVRARPIENGNQGGLPQEVPYEMAQWGFSYTVYDKAHDILAKEGQSTSDGDECNPNWNHIDVSRHVKEAWFTDLLTSSEVACETRDFFRKVCDLLDVEYEDYFNNDMFSNILCSKEVYQNIADIHDSSTLKNPLAIYTKQLMTQNDMPFRGLPIKRKLSE